MTSTLDVVNTAAAGKMMNIPLVAIEMVAIQDREILLKVRMEIVESQDGVRSETREVPMRVDLKVVIGLKEEDEARAFKECDAKYF